MTVIEYATNGLRSDLERVGADVDESLFADLDTMTTGYGSDDEREALLESARWVHLTLEPMLDANESTWVEADSRQAYEHVLHRHGAADAVRLTRGRSFEALSAIETLSSRSEWMFFHEPFYAGHDHGLAIHPDRPNRLFAGVEHGAFIYSYDRGDSWDEALRTHTQVSRPITEQSRECIVY